MPDVFDRFFSDFGKNTSDYYKIDKLDPAYKIFFDDEIITIGDSMDKICSEFERIEKGSGNKLKKFITYLRRLSNAVAYVSFGATPTCLSTNSPLLKTSTVGIFLTPYFAANS